MFFPYTNFTRFYSHPLPANDFYPHQQDVRGMPPFRQFIGPEPATPENQSASQCRACESPFTSNASDSPNSASTGGNSGKSDMKSGVRLWAENFDYLESKDARKVWERIARELSAKCGTKKTSDKCQKNEVLDRPLQGCERLEQEPERGKSKTVHLLRGIDEVFGCKNSVTLRHVVLVLMSLWKQTMKKRSLKAKRTQRTERKRARGEGNVKNSIFRHGRVAQRNEFIHGLF